MDRLPSEGISDERQVLYGVQLSHGRNGAGEPCADRADARKDSPRSTARWCAGSRACRERTAATVFVCHTSASLTIQENAEPNVQRDLIDALEPWRRSMATTPIRGGP